MSLRTKLSRRLAAKLGKAHRGMTLLEIMIVLAILALVMGLVVGPRVMRLFGQSKEKIAWITAQKLANEQYGDWAQSHPGKSCPDKLEDLTANANSDDKNDPWGQPYKMFCGPTLPAGVKSGVAIQSNGPNGKDDSCADNSDDICSWKKQPE